ncbi:hypothetical protein JCM5353_006333 [Sporobolomyces roseus]
MSALPPLPGLPEGFPPPGFGSVDHSLVPRASAVNIFRRYSIAWLAIAFFDTFATFPIEWEHIWWAKLTPIKTCFLINRWSSLVIQVLLLIFRFAELSNETCSRIYFFNSFGGIFISFFVACILSIRVWVLWDKKKAVLALLIFLMATQVGLQTFSAARIRPFTLPRDFQKLIKLPGCGVQVNGRPATGTETILAGKVPLYRRLMLDGAQYFAIITSSNLVAVVFTTQTADPLLRPFQNPASLALTSIVCSRLVLSLFSRKPSGTSNATSPRSSPAKSFRSVFSAKPRTINTPSRTDLEQSREGGGTKSKEGPDEIALRNFANFGSNRGHAGIGVDETSRSGRVSGSRSKGTGGVQVNHETSVEIE